MSASGATSKATLCALHNDSPGALCWRAQKTCGHFKLGTSCARELEESSAETFLCIYLSITCFRVSFVRSFVRCTASQET